MTSKLYLKESEETLNLLLLGMAKLGGRSSMAMLRSGADMFFEHPAGAFLSELKSLDFIFCNIVYVCFLIFNFIFMKLGMKI